MTENFIIILIALFLSFFTIIYLIHNFIVKVLNDKYLVASKTIQMKINRFKHDYGEIVEEPSEFTGKALGNIGIDGILDSLGLPSIVKPIAKGFIEKIIENPAPLINKLREAGIKVDLSNVTQEKNTNSLPSQV